MHNTYTRRQKYKYCMISLVEFKKVKLHKQKGKQWLSGAGGERREDVG